MRRNSAMKLSEGYSRHPMVQYVRSLDGDFYLAREAADQLGVSLSVLRGYGARLSAEGYGPSHRAMYGSIPLALYSAERLEKIRTRIAADRKRSRPGAPVLWTPTERRDRRLALENCRAARRRIAAHIAAGEEKKAARLQKEHDRKYARLMAERDKRAKETASKKKTRGKRAAK